LSSALPAIDCDVHPAAPTVAALLPLLEEHWRNSVVEREIPSLEINSYPARAPISARPQWRGRNGAPDATLGQLTGQVFDRWQARLGVRHPHRQILVRPLAASHPAISGIGSPGCPAGGGTLRRGILSGPAGG
jgi:hypothetical protein